MSDVSNFRLNVVKEQTEVIKLLLDLTSKLSTTISYLPPDTVIAICNDLNTLANNISEFYEQVKLKENLKSA